jgi:hypothetical protein
VDAILAPRRGPPRSAAPARRLDTETVALALRPLHGGAVAGPAGVMCYHLVRGPGRQPVMRAGRTTGRRREVGQEEGGREERGHDAHEPLPCLAMCASRMHRRRSPARLSAAAHARPARSGCAWPGLPTPVRVPRLRGATTYRAYQRPAVRETLTERRESPDASAPRITPARSCGPSARPPRPPGSPGARSPSRCRSPRRGRRSAGRARRRRRPPPGRGGPRCA